MIRINLLPEEFRPRKRKLRITRRWGYVTGAVVGLFLILMALTLVQQSRLGRLQEDIRETRIEAERQKADLKLVQELSVLKEKILQRMQVVEKLNRNRTRWIEILAALSKSVPEDTWLIAFKENPVSGEARAAIEGMSFSLRPIAFFMDHLEETQWFSHPQFAYAQRIPVSDGMAYNFEIQVGLLSYQKQAAALRDSSQGNLQEGLGQKKKIKGK